MNRMTDAYAAGLIDGEGCIGIYQSKGGATYSARVDVGMTTKAHEVLAHLLRTYGGSIQQSRPATAEWEAAECWVLHGTATVRLLERLSPYLRLKVEQAEVALKVQQIVAELPKTPTGRSRWTAEARRRCATLKTRMHELNRKGPTTPSPENRVPFARLVAGTWVTDQRDLFSDLGWESFTGPWPRSGTTHAGAAYRLPPWVPHTAANDYSPSPTLPTPMARDGQHSRSARPPRGGRNGTMLDEAVCHLLPTPRASDGTNGGPNQRGSSGDLMMPSAVMLLPTPRAMDSCATPGSPGSARHVAAGNGSLVEVIGVHLMPTPRTTDAKWPGLHGSGGMDLRTAVSTLPAGASGLPQSSGGSGSPDLPLMLWSMEPEETAG